MLETYKAMRARGAAFGQGYDGLKLENERLKAKIAELEAAGVPAPSEPGASSGTNAPVSEPGASSGTNAPVSEPGASSGTNAPVGGSNVVPLSRPPSPPAAPA